MDRRLQGKIRCGQAQSNHRSALQQRHVHNNPYRDRLYRNKSTGVSLDIVNRKHHLAHSRKAADRTRHRRRDSPHRYRYFGRPMRRTYSLYRSVSASDDDLLEQDFPESRRNAAVGSAPDRYRGRCAHRTCQRILRCKVQASSLYRNAFNAAHRVRCSSYVPHDRRQQRSDPLRP